MSHFLAFNPENPVLKSPIRQAMDSAINKKELSTKQLNGLFRDNVEYVTSDNQPTSTYDLKKAQSILEQGGFQKNSQGYYEKEGKELAFKLVIQTTEFPEWKEQAEVIESELKKTGIKVTITILDSESYYDVLWNTKDFDLIFYRTYTDALLPYNFLNSLFHNTAETHGVLADDVALTKLLDQSALTINETTQQEIFDEILKRINQETLAIPIDYKDEIFVTSEKIAEFSYSGLSDAPIDFKNIKVK
jgi:peptide/nickel transport system substrate-binding protein